MSSNPFVLWWAAVALLAWYGLTRRSTPDRPAPYEPRALAWLVTAGALVAVARAPFAIGREWRNPDEYAYLAAARFACDSGEPLLACVGHVRLHGLLFALGGGRTFAVVDALTSGVVGLAGVVLGDLVLRRTGSRRLGALTVVLYAVGLLPFEGLSSNAEPYAALGLSLYLWARLRSPDPEPSPWSSVLAGAALALAALSKEQALAFVAVEPLLWLLRRRGAAPRALVRELGLVAAGFALGLAPMVALLARAGVLAEHASNVLHFALSLGSPTDAGLPDVLEPTESRTHVQELVLGGHARLLSNPVTWLALVGVALALAPGAPRRERLGAALAVPFAVALLVASAGLRFFGHYFMLALPAAAPLAALGVRRVVQDLRRGGPQAPAAVGVLLALVASCTQLLRTPASTLAGAAPLAEDELAKLPELRAALDAHPPDARLFVAGWRAELYHVLDRTPASRFVSGGAFDWPTIERDLARHPPALIVVPRTTLLGRWSWDGGRLRFSWLKLDLVDQEPRFHAWCARAGVARTELGPFAVYRR